ncbi:phytoene desaturase family protein [Thermodesulfobacteriota bacterium]
MRYPLVIIGGGLSGLAAGIRCARFGHKTLILEKHTIPGGLNSYYYRKGILLETGLHAMTNYAEAADRRAPLCQLFRQLKLSRRNFVTHQQTISEIQFLNRERLLFSNDLDLLSGEIARAFPHCIDRFVGLVETIRNYDSFTPAPWVSTRSRLKEALGDDLLIEMLLCPLMFYGNSEEHDMDFSQFVIMFRSIFLEGFFRPEGTIKDFLDQLLEQFKSFGGEIRLRSGVKEILRDQDRVQGVVLESGETIPCEYLLSTAGYPNTLGILQEKNSTEMKQHTGRISFVEMMYFLSQEAKQHLVTDRTIIFYNDSDKFSYRRPGLPVDVASGVICFPDHFTGLPERERMQLRVTHIANYQDWKQAPDADYQRMKGEWGMKSQKIIGKIIGNYQNDIVYEDSFTPVTIEKFTGKAEGAVYGSPRKIKDGSTAYENLFVAGTDQGFLGIVGSMLSGVSIVNQHILGQV